jgi:hypothetical protein
VARRYRGGRRYHSGGYSSNYNAGYERARQHIEDARRLSAELGEMDKDVKDYFFSLSQAELRNVLNEYERRHGRARREYAEETIPKWRSGTVTMSGTVAERLFSLLPPRMPLASKYKLTEGLWKHVGPSSKKRLRVGLEADLEIILTAVRNHIEEVVVNYRVPENLERRFMWLAAGDVSVKQQLLNHLRQMEKAHVVEGARLQLPMMLEHLRSDSGNHTHRLTQTLKIGKHELEIMPDRNFSGVALEEWTPPSRLSGSGASGCFSSTWFWWVVAAVALYLLLKR